MASKPLKVLDVYNYNHRRQTSYTYYISVYEDEMI